MTEIKNKNNLYERTELLIGESGINKLQKSHVLIAGLGGVGGVAAEMLCRAGIGNITIADNDVFSSSNKNRQIGALTSTEGKAKTDVIKKRLLDINPKASINTFNKYIKDSDLIEIITAYPYDYVIDAIDTLSPKVYLIYQAVKHNLKLVSSMGAGGKLDPLAVKISDISKSYECRFAYDVRKRLHKLGIEKGFDVVFSSEKVPRTVIEKDESMPNKKTVVGTISYLPTLFGIYCSSVVIRNLIKE